MLKLTRTGRAALASEAEQPGETDTSRRSFLRSSGAVAAIVAVPTAGFVATTAEADAAANRVAPARAVDNPEDAAPDQPVMAYIHDAHRGEVVIMNKDHQRTVVDHELVKRLTTVPPKKTGKHRRKHGRTASMSKAGR